MFGGTLSKDWSIMLKFPLPSVALLKSLANPIISATGSFACISTCPEVCLISNIWPLLLCSNFVISPIKSKGPSTNNV